MKRIFNLLLLLLLLGCNSSFAQKLKLKESSAPKAPEWINNIERGYLIARSTNSDMELAQQYALLDVKQQIAQSIATNISTELFQSSVQVSTNEGTKYQSEMVDVVRASTDKIPYLQSISLSKVAEYYWEKRYDKKSKVTEYSYYIKYPFSDGELDQLVAEFNAMQARINSTIEQMSQELESFTQIEDIAKNMGTLRALIPELAAGDPRITVVDELVNTYRDQYRYISIEQVEHSSQRVVLQPYLNGRVVTTSQIPLHKSNCADRITKSVTQGVIVVGYDNYVCRSGDDNWIDLTFKFGSNLVISKIHIIK